MSEPKIPITIRVNGEDRTGEAEPRMLLSDFLRGELDLTGTRIGCEHGVCGACTVQVDGLPVRSCLMFAIQAQGHEITTVEGIGTREALHPLQQAFRDHHALQCGYCTAGILMTLTAFLKDNPAPGEADIREALSGNLCRCTGYQNMVDAVLSLAAPASRARAT